MVESCPKDSPGQQTLLEAAKAMSCQCTGHPSQAQWEVAVANLRAAIARDEAKASYVSEADVSDFWSDRAQQAESAAAWHKAESERLSAELALARNQLTLAVERSERLSGQLAGCHYDLGEARKQRQRAEKAEAECSEQRARAESGEDRNRDLSEKLIAAHGKTHAESERAKKTESELAKERATSSQFLAEIGAAAGRKFNEPITQTIENLRQRAELAESMLAKPQQSHPMDGGDITVMLNRAGVKAHEEGVPLSNRDRILWLLSEWGRLKMGGQPRFDGDPKACAFPSGAFSNAGPSHDLKPFMAGAAAADALIEAVGTFRALSIAADAVAKALGGKS